MTPAAQTLCRDIAKLEEWESTEKMHPALGVKWWKADEFRYSKSIVPDWYLTDPDETVRMVEALCEGYNSEVHLVNEGNGNYSVAAYRWDKNTDQDKCIVDRLAKGSPRSIAEAYKALLLAKEKENA